MKTFKYSAKKICSRCIMDDTVPGIVFDDNGECTFCKIHDELSLKFPLNDSANIELIKIVKSIKSKGVKNKYDCIVGISGGRDSTYTLLSVIKLGLRPLVVHFDNGWNTELAVNNIENICTKLNVDLHTHVANWEEFKDLQKSFLKASVPDAEVPTDWAIFSVLFKVASDNNIKYIIQGHSFRTEGTTPLTWTYMDGKYIKEIHKLYGTKKIKSFPIMNMYNYFYYTLFKRIKQIRILYYMPYKEKDVLSLLKSEVGWRDYGGKHHESKYTGFFQSYILPRKFNIDKRKLHYSALIRSSQMNRSEAIERVKIDPYDDPNNEALNYCLKKLEFSAEEFNDIMMQQPKTFRSYKSYYSLIIKTKVIVKLGTKLNLIPDIIYKKYFRFFNE